MLVLSEQELHFSGRWHLSLYNSYSIHCMLFLSSNKLLLFIRIVICIFPSEKPAVFRNNQFFRFFHVFRQIFLDVLPGKNKCPKFTGYSAYGTGCSCRRLHRSDGTVYRPSVCPRKHAFAFNFVSSTLYDKTFSGTIQRRRRQNGIIRVHTHTHARCSANGAYREPSTTRPPMPQVSAVGKFKTV